MQKQPHLRGCFYIFVSLPRLPGIYVEVAQADLELIAAALRQDNAGPEVVEA